MATEKTTPTAGHTNPDPITGAPASHPGATGIGSASGAATGAALGAIGGPVGAVIGGIAGAAVGGGVGHSIGEAHDPSDAAYWKNEYKNRPYFNKSANYDRDVAPAYHYGSSLHSQSAVQAQQGSTSGSTFNRLEERARREWDKVRGQSSLSYEEARNPIQDAFERRAQRIASNGGGQQQA